MKNIGLKLALFIAIIVIGYLSFKISTQKPTAITVVKQSDVIDKFQTEAKKIASEVDKKGYAKTVFERKEAIINSGDVTKLPVSQSVLDSLRLDNIDKSKKLIQASLINGSINARALRAEKRLDSLKHEQFVYTDDFLTAVYTPDTLGGKFDVNYKIVLIRHDYKKRKNFFSPYRNYTDILSPDKRILINNLQAITIEQNKPKRFGVGLQVGYYFNPVTSKFNSSFGLGFSYNIIRF